MNTLFPWQNVYLDAVLETDNLMLPQRIMAAENTIKARATELGKDHQSTQEEREAIAAALNALAILRKERISD